MKIDNIGHCAYFKSLDLIVVHEDMAGTFIADATSYCMVKGASEFRHGTVERDLSSTTTITFYQLLSYRIPDIKIML